LRAPIIRRASTAVRSQASPMVSPRLLLPGRGGRTPQDLACPSPAPVKRNKRALAP
jgi:hypothetical protein